MNKLRFGDTYKVKDDIGFRIKYIIYTALSNYDLSLPKESYEIISRAYDSDKEAFEAYTSYLTVQNEMKKGTLIKKKLDLENKIQRYQEEIYDIQIEIKDLSKELR